MISSKVFAVRTSAAVMVAAVALSGAPFVSPVAATVRQTSETTVAANLATSKNSYVSKKRAKLSVTAKRTPSNKIVLSIRSNARSVKLSYVDGNGNLKIRVVPVKGKAIKFLPASVSRVKVRTVKSVKFRASKWMKVPVPTRIIKPREDLPPITDPTEGSDNSSGDSDVSDGDNSDDGFNIDLPEPDGRPIPEFTAELTSIVNEVRAKGTTCGGVVYPPMPPLRSDEALRAAGQDLAEWYYNTGTIGVVTPEDPLDRAYRFGWEPRTPKNTWVQLAIFLGDEIALRLALAGQMEDSYYDSVCRALLIPESTVMGVGASGPKKAYARPIVIYVDRPPFTS